MEYLTDPVIAIKIIPANTAKDMPNNTLYNLLRGCLNLARSSF